MAANAIRVLRVAAIAAGVLMVLCALLADELGLDSSPDFGSGETLLLAAGLLTGLAGALGRRLPAFYRATAIVLLNTLLLLMLVELSVIVIDTLRGTALRRTGVVDALTDYYLEVPYYSQQDWADRYWREVRSSAAKRYHPFVVWRSAPFSGRTLYIDDDGLRRTPGNECDAGAYTVYAFGGSAMWGLGAPDWGTIPAYLRAGLERQRGEPVCLVNFAQDAYISTQSVVQLVLLLEAGERPDLVLFYSGVNDVIGAHQSGRPLVHHEFRRFRDRVEQRHHPLIRWLTNLRTVQLLTGLGSDGTAPGPQATFDPAALAEQVVDVFLGVHEIVVALAGAYEFDFALFWQPYILVGAKRLTPEEHKLVEGVDWMLQPDASLVALFTETYLRLGRTASALPGLHDLSGTFDEVDTQIWIDAWGHVTPEGNEIVASKMLSILVHNAPPTETR